MHSIGLKTTNMKKLLIKFFLYQFRIINRYRIKKYGEPKTVDLEKKHFFNSTLIPDRITLLDLLPKNSICSEIGVDEGIFSNEIIKITNPKELFLIDFWEGSIEHKKKYVKVTEKFKNDNCVKIIKDDSVKAADNFKDHFFDFIYLDTSKTYDQTLSELMAYKDKIKKNGFICGHDYTDGSWVNLTRWRVKEAVRFFCVKEGWRFVYLTQEKNGYESYCITRI